MDSIYKYILKERSEKYEIETLMDEETLNLLTGIPVAQLRKSIDTYGLVELVKFAKSMNLTKTQKRKLELLYNFTKRLNLSTYKQKTVLNSSVKSGRYFIKELQFQTNELFLVALLDSQNRLIKAEVTSKGTINEALVYPREIMKLVLDNNANAVILAHNHPGGNRQPSNQDVEVTKKIADALKTVNVKVIDHIIVADNTFVSFAERGLLNP